MAATAAAQNRKRPVEWKPRLGILGPFTESNVRFAKEEGFTNMILGAGRNNMPDPEKVRPVLARYGMHVSAFQASQNHIAPDLAQRKQENDDFVRIIELAGKLGIPFIGTTSGKNPAKPFNSQIDDIVRVYNERYVAAG